MGKKIYVGNLPFRYGFKEIKSLFEKFGDIEDAVVIADRENGRSKGFGFVTFVDEASAQKAIAEMDGKDAEGRPLKVNAATPREDAPKEDAKETKSEDKPEESEDKPEEKTE